MADAPTLADVGRIVSYVAPGFFARVAYGARFPQRSKEQFELLLISVAFSLPLVALANQVADWAGLKVDPIDVGYVALLLGLSCVIGYVVALLRGLKPIRAAMASVGLSY